MYLNHIKLTNFKNYESEELRLSEGLNCFVGRNGMGKTNLLDAIYYLCMCKSNFGLTDGHICRHEADFFRLEGRFVREGKKEKVVAKVIPRKKKSMERNDVLYKTLSEHIGLLPVVMIIPDDTKLVTEGSEERRRLVDNTLSQYDAAYLSDLLRYNRLLKQRNAALKQMGAEGRFNLRLIQAYDQQMVEPARHIHQKRQAFLAQFVTVFQQYYSSISGRQEEVDCRYHSQLEKEDFLTLMEAASEKDRILQRTTAGIHKDDLKLFIDGHVLKRFASQGQLKSFVLALKLAQYDFLRQEKNIAPLLLLDDIFDKLDSQRVKQLIDLLMEQNFGQVCITDTHNHRLKEVIEAYQTAHKLFRVDKGQVQEEQF
ncbi:MAG: DNA replication/repair protein RecF [Bacteroidota bacterium]